MLVQYLMLLLAYYSQNWASIIGSSLSAQGECILQWCRAKHCETPLDF